ncbi:MAG: hypothetical protein J5J06_01910 [Phycisphaerae bacterium]|nr:hypothetical protein [Phycisphaerae bacterium]
MPDVTGNSGEIDPNLTVARDVPCRRCGYNLRGLSPAGRCPECAAPVIVALQPDILAFADPRWLDTLACGQRLFGRGTWSYLFLSLVFSRFKAVLPPGVYTLLATMVLALLLFVILRGIWLILAPPPAEFTTGGRWSDPRHIARTALVVAGVVLAVNPVVWQWLGTSAVILLQSLLGPAGVVGLVGLMAMSRYVEHLCHRSYRLSGSFHSGAEDGDHANDPIRTTSSKFIINRARLYRKGYLVSWLVCVPSVLVLHFLGGSAAACTLIPGMVGMFGSGVLLMYLPGYLVDVIESQHKIATRIWQRAEAEGRIDDDLVRFVPDPLT